ncbi:hypothetical protein WEN_01305 [Mycoplasma wenyonii str. Massachusetts]|uniref:Uncharacterized protein n=1 Tax=Mycoplasma wenyonii (strain Massachusetts) TaxID=1197325 RepID=I6ZIP2_MYCWM|nr:hypothetical protein [Mycoplasma wenyonii]AFN65060.1 hypothetical protein WEN_01305 [Mycoplasma wenyonii str. Massachusetts]
MTLKRLIILPALIPFAFIPFLQNSFKTTPYLPKEKIKSQKEKSIPLRKQHLQRECISFSDSPETIFICKPSSRGDKSPLFFYARFRYEERNKETPSSILFTPLQRLNYDNTTEELVVKFFGEQKARIREFPEEFKELEDNFIDPNKSCRWGEEGISFQCQFSSNKAYLDIFLPRN